MDAAHVAGMIQSELIALMIHSREIGKRLLIARSHGDFALMCERNRFSEPHAQLLIYIAEREAQLRDEGKTELQAVETLVADRKLLNQVLAHTAQMVEGML
jgi:hypothetical protein